MKNININSIKTFLGTILCLGLVLPAAAQRGSTGGGGGGHSSGGGSGGGSVSVSHASSGGSSGGGSYRASNGNSGFSRPSFQRSSAPQGGINRSGYTQGRVTGNYGYPQRNTAIRGNYGYPLRNGVSAVRGATYGGNTTYRTGRGGYWGTHNYTYYNRGYYNSYYYPQLGFTCGYLPYGYFPFYYGDDQFYYSQGLFYTYNDNEYTVVEPPIGAEITTLPQNAQSIVINGQQYYEENGVYYQPVTKDDGTTTYQVAGKDGELNTGTNVQDDQQQQGPQMGDVLPKLPSECKKIKVNGQKLYVSPEGVYYQEQKDVNGSKSYVIVGLPNEEPDQN